MNWTTTNTECTVLLQLSLPQGQPVWWSVTLQRPAFISKIWIINRPGCCLAEMTKHNVILRNHLETVKANCKVYSWKERQKTLMICEPSISTSNVTIYENSVGELRLCEVMITTIGEKRKRFYYIIIKLYYNPNSSLKTVVFHSSNWNQIIQRNIRLKDLQVENLTRSRCLDVLAPKLCKKGKTTIFYVDNS